MNNPYLRGNLKTIGFVKIKIPFNKTYLINKVYSQFEIKSNIQKEDCTELEVLISELEYQKIMKALKE